NIGPPFASAVVAGVLARPGGMLVHVTRSSTGRRDSCTTRPPTRIVSCTVCGTIAPQYHSSQSVTDPLTFVTRSSYVVFDGAIDRIAFASAIDSTLLLASDQTSNSSAEPPGYVASVHDQE